MKGRSAAAGIFAMAMCVLGCDALFERGYLSVANGAVAVSQGTGLPDDLRRGQFRDRLDECFTVVRVAHRVYVRELTGRVVNPRGPTRCRLKASWSCHTNHCPKAHPATCREQ
jgi:hypothetical protein